METIFFWVGGAEVLAVVTLIVTVIVQWGTAAKLRPYSQLQTDLREVEQQLADLTDHITRRETRERVRKMRDGREAAAAGDGALPPPGSPGYKDALRRLAMSRVPRA